MEPGPVVSRFKPAGCRKLLQVQAIIVRPVNVPVQGLEIDRLAQFSFDYYSGGIDALQDAMISVTTGVRDRGAIQGVKAPVQDKVRHRRKIFTGNHKGTLMGIQCSGTGIHIGFTNPEMDLCRPVQCDNRGNRVLRRHVPRDGPGLVTAGRHFFLQPGNLFPQINLFTQDCIGRHECVLRISDTSFLYISEKGGK